MIDLTWNQKVSRTVNSAMDSWKQIIAVIDNQIYVEGVNRCCRIIKN